MTSKERDAYLDSPLDPELGIYILDVASHTPRRAKTHREWVEFMARDRDGRVVKQETVGRLWVSTVFLTIDYNFSEARAHRPILFETMIFDAKHHTHAEEFPSDARRRWAESQWRHYSWDAAEWFHDFLVLCLKGGAAHYTRRLAAVLDSVA